MTIPRADPGLQPATAAGRQLRRCGLLKADRVLGGTAWWDIAPLSPEQTQQARTYTAPRWFVVTDQVTVVLAVVGVVFALATLRPHRWYGVAGALLPMAAGGADGAARGVRDGWRHPPTGDRRGHPDQRVGPRPVVALFLVWDCCGRPLHTPTPLRAAIGRTRP